MLISQCIYHTSAPVTSEYATSYVKSRAELGAVRSEDEKRMKLALDHLQ
jgi:hypothetical protein